jgi:hypothetical protein
MIYTKYFQIKDTIIIFDKLEANRYYLNQYILYRNGAIAGFIRKDKIKVISKSNSYEDFRIITFSYSE